MGSIGRVRTALSPSPGSRAGGPAALARALVREPFTRRARLELLFCLAGIPLGLCVLVVPYWGVGFALAVALLAPAYGSTWVAGVAALLGLLLLVVLATRIARGLGAVHRGLAARLLGEPVAPPPPRPGRGVLGRLGAGLRDGPGDVDEDDALLRSGHSEGLRSRGTLAGRLGRGGDRGRSPPRPQHQGPEDGRADDGDQDPRLLAAPPEAFESFSPRRGDDDLVHPCMEPLFDPQKCGRRHTRGTFEGPRCGALASAAPRERFPTEAGRRDAQGVQDFHPAR